MSRTGLPGLRRHPTMNTVTRTTIITTVPIWRSVIQPWKPNSGSTGRGRAVDQRVPDPIGDRTVASSDRNSDQRGDDEA